MVRFSEAGLVGETCYIIVQQCFPVLEVSVQWFERFNLLRSCYGKIWSLLEYEKKYLFFLRSKWGINIPIFMISFQ